jgi:hypothetical protein
VVSYDLEGAVRVYGYPSKLINTDRNNPELRGDKHMSYNRSTLLTRNLDDVFGENDPRAHARGHPRDIHRRLRVLRTQGRAAGTSKATHPDFRYQPIARRKNWEMAGGSDGYQAALVRRQLTRGPISSLPGTAGLPPFI